MSAGRKCTVCLHPKRSAIDSAIVAGEALRGIARQFAVGPDAVERHANAHVPKSLAKATDATHGLSLLAEVTRQRDRAEALFEQAQAVLRQARRRKDHAISLDAIRTATATLREVRGMFDLLLRAALAHGELVDRAELRNAIAVVEQVCREFVPEPERQRALGARMRLVIEGGGNGKDRSVAPAVSFLQPAVE